MLYQLARPLLFSLDAETAHELTLAALNLARWIAENAQFLRPPVGNKQLYTGADDVAASWAATVGRTPESVGIPAPAEPAPEGGAR